MIRTIAVCAILIAFGISPAQSQHFDPTQPLSRDQIAFAEHLARHYSAYFLRLNENVGPGDTLLLPSFRRDAPRETCFPSMNAPEKHPQGRYEIGKRKNDLSGKLVVEAGISASVDVKFVEEIDNALVDVQASYLPYEARTHYDRSICPWIEEFYQANRHNGRHLLVRAVIYAQGQFAINYEFGVAGGISADVAAKIRSYLDKLKLSSILPDEKIEAALSGSFQRSDPAASEWSQLAPVGFIPESINEDNMRRFVEVFLYKKRDEELWDAIRSAPDAAEFLNRNPEFVMKEGDAPFLLREGRTVALNIDDGQHRYAVWADSALVLINMLALSQ